MGDGEGEKFSFIAEWYDPQAAFIRRYILSFHPKDGTAEMYDLKNRKPFLRRTKLETLGMADLYIGNAVTILARQLKIVDFADDYTRCMLGAKMERTIGLIQPDAISKTPEILDIIFKAGLTLSRLKMCHLSQNDAYTLLADFQHEETFNEKVGYCTSGPCVAMELMGNDAINRWKAELGPEDSCEARKVSPMSIRARFGKDEIHNAVGGSADPVQAAREVEFFFPASGPSKRNTACLSGSSCCVIKPHAIFAGQHGAIIRRIQDQFEITAMLMLPMEKANVEEFYEVYKSVVQEYPDMVSELISGPCIALEVRHKAASYGPAGPQDIVKDFRAVCGPADPEIARHLRPHTIRAQFGMNKVKNAVHCTDLPDDGPLEVEYFFRILDRN